MNPDENLRLLRVEALLGIAQPPLDWVTPEKIKELQENFGIGLGTARTLLIKGYGHVPKTMDEARAQSRGETKS